MTDPIDPRPALQDRTEFKDEAIRLTDLIRDGEFLLTGYTFRRCALLGPATVVALNNNHFEFIAYGHPVEKVMLVCPEGSSALGAIGLNRCTFIQCHWQQITVEATVIAAAQLMPAFHSELRSAWAKRVGYKGEFLWPDPPGSGPSPNQPPPRGVRPQLVQ